MDSKTYLKNLRISPKKLRFYLDDIKKNTPQSALERLYYSRGKAGKVFYKALKSAIANAVSTLKTEAHLLQFKLLTVEEGQKLKRYRAGGRGTAKPILRRYSHIKITLAAVNSVPSKQDVPKKNLPDNRKENKTEAVKITEEPKTGTVKKTAQVRHKKDKADSKLKEKKS